MRFSGKTTGADGAVYCTAFNFTIRQMERKIRSIIAITQKTAGIFTVDCCSYDFACLHHQFPVGIAGADNAARERIINKLTGVNLTVC